jgi:hypothetical protein
MAEERGGLEDKEEPNRSLGKARNSEDDDLMASSSSAAAAANRLLSSAAAAAGRRFSFSCAVADSELSS